VVVLAEEIVGGLAEVLDTHIGTIKKGKRKKIEHQSRTFQDGGTG
jgi:hypothetical protein